MDQGAIPPQPIDAFDQQLLAQNQMDGGNNYQSQSGGSVNPWEQPGQPPIPQPPQPFGQQGPMGPMGPMGQQGPPMGFRGGPPPMGFRGGQGPPMGFPGGPFPGGPMGPMSGPMGFRGGPPFGGPMGFPQPFPFGGPAASPMPMSANGGQPCTTVWVGGLTDSTTEDDLTKFFGCFGTLDNVKLLPAKNCAFIRYTTIPEAIAAFHGMANKIINGNQIRVGWGKTENLPDNNNNNSSQGSGGQEPCRNLYVGNIDGDLSEEQLHREFSRYGSIEKIKTIPQKGCAFVTFHSLASALDCRKKCHGTIMFGRPVKINFGKLSTEGIGQDNDSINNVPVSDSNYLNIGPPQPPAPHDEKQREIIDKFAASVVKSGPQFEDVVKEKQRNNVMFDFLNEGGLYADYYRWKLFDLRRASKEAEANPFQSILHQATQVVSQPGEPSRFNFQQQQMGGMNHMMQQQQQQQQQQHHHQQQQQPQQGPPSTPRHIGLGLIAEERSALSQLLDSLVPTKDAIKKGKDYIVSLDQTASAVAEFMCERLEKTPDWSAKLNIIYLTNEVLHHCVKLRPAGVNSDPFSNAFLPYLPAMLYSAYVNQTPDRREKIEKIIDIWKTKTVYSAHTVADISQQINPQIQPQQNMGGSFGGNARGGMPGAPNVSSMLHELQHNSAGKFRNVSPPPNLFMGNHPMQQHAPNHPMQQSSNIDSFLKSKKAEVLGNDGRSNPGQHWDREPQRIQQHSSERDRGERDRGERDRGERDRGERDRGRDDRDRDYDRDRKRGRDDNGRSHSPQRRRY